MEMNSGAAELTDFCLVLTPTLNAPERAGDAIRNRFKFLDDETRGNVAAVVAELVQRSVERRPRGPITVTIALDADAIHGEVSDHGDLRPFHIPMPR
jgi:hypothetical protein